MDATGLTQYAVDFQKLCVQRWPEVEKISDETLADLANFLMLVYIGRKVGTNPPEGFQSLT